MNKIKASNLKPALIIALIVFIAVVVLGFIYQDALQETILISFQYILWVGGIFIKNLDQRYLWLQILMVSLFFAFGFSRLFPSPFENRRKTIDNNVPPENGRIDFWQYRIYMYRSVRSGRIFSLLDFPRLINETLAFHERSDPETINAEILGGDLQVPPEVYSVVAMDDFPAELDQDTKAVRGGENLIDRITGRPQTPKFASDARLEKVATYLENLLEDKNDS